MAQHTTLTSDDLAAALGGFGLAAPEHAEPEPRGRVNTSFHVWSGGERLFLRVCEDRSDADVTFEAEVQRFLHAARFPVPRPLAAAGGAPFVRVAGKQAMMFAYAPGEECSRDDAGPGRCRRVGEQLGRLHDLAAGFTEDRENPFGPPRVAGWLDAARPRAEGDAREALPLLEEELARAARLPAAPRGLVHGDLFRDNVLWIGDRVSAVLDWEMSCVAPFAWDLAIAVSAWCYTDRYDSTRAAALLEGYRSRRRLDPDTAAALWAWARFAALRFAASRLEAEGRVALGPDRMVRKDWRRYRDRLLALRAMGEDGFRALCGR
jgi:homoserine kinase type II